MSATHFKTRFGNVERHTTTPQGAVGSPNYYWTKAGYTIKREPLAQGVKRTVLDLQGVAVDCSHHKLRNKHAQELAEIKARGLDK